MPSVNPFEYGQSNELRICNFHNGRGGTYDCIALMSYFKVCRSVTSLKEIEEMEGALFLPAFKILHRFVNCNRPFWKHMMQRSFMTAKSKCDQWHDYEMHVAPFDNDKPIYYEFTHCPSQNLRKSTICLRSCPRCATRTTPRWN